MHQSGALSRKVDIYLPNKIDLRGLFDQFIDLELEVTGG
jgi:hypothetical protein